MSYAWCINVLQSVALEPASLIPSLYEQEAQINLSSHLNCNAIGYQCWEILSKGIFSVIA